MTDVFPPAGPIGVRLDRATGLLTALLHRVPQGEPVEAVPVVVGLTLVTGGTEHIGPVGGLRYEGTDRSPLPDLSWSGATLRDEGDARSYVVTAHSGGWQVELAYRLSAEAPHVAFGFTLSRTSGTEVLLRDVEVRFTYPLGEVGDWIVNAPGNQFRADVPAAEFTTAARVFTAGDTFGSPGLVALSLSHPPAPAQMPQRHRPVPRTLVLWPWCRTEVGRLDLVLDGDRLRVDLATGLAGRVSPQRPALTWRTAYLDSLGLPWSRTGEALTSWWHALGAQGMSEAPPWMRRAHIYEAHIGFSVFAGGVQYQRYASIEELRADLPRIQQLGFDAIQLMPRHPYPSYNVHDYADITTTYGDEAALRELVADCHRRGIRVLLDIIMHGVIDKQVMAETLDAVTAGPYAQRLGDGEIDYLSRSAEDIAWSRHIVEYAPYWRDGSPDRHPLPAEHPEWFITDSAGAIARRYTKAFDTAHPGWQRYFLDACAELVRRLDVDGFRVDAPTYHDFAAWSPEREIRASHTAMASLGLLGALRRRLRTIRSDLTVYTEPTGALFRAAADATYNYDEHWLIESLLAGPHPDALRQRRLLRHAADLARWLHDRDQVTPPGATIVHHVDSHDSIWWRLPGAQWRRERFGRDAAVALLAVFSLTGGAFMTFMGGEDGIEEELRRVHDLRRRLPAIAGGTVDYESVAASSEDVFVVLRRAPESTAVVAVNLAAVPVACELALPASAGERIRDEWNEEWISGPADDGKLRIGFAPYQPRLLRLSRTSSPGSLAR
jgi:glycosidase